MARASLLVGLVAGSLALPGIVEGQSRAPASHARDLVLDYDVPESPALVALGNPDLAVLRGGIAKPVVARLVNQILSGDEIETGVALDFNPYFLYGGGVRSAQQYWDSALQRILANLQVSVATIQDETEESSLRFGTGVRVTFHDAHDLLQDEQLGRAIDDALKAASRRVGPDVVDTGDEVGPPRSVPGLEEAYEAARSRVAETTGSAFSAGWGLAGDLRGSVVDGDSLRNVRNTLWVASSYYFPMSIDLLSTLRWLEAGEDEESSLLLGAALRSGNPDFQFTAEVFYSSAGGGNGGRLGFGGAAEIRVLPGVRVVASLESEPVEEERDTTKLRLRTNLKWSMSAQP